MERRVHMQRQASRRLGQHATSRQPAAASRPGRAEAVPTAGTRQRPAGVETHPAGKPERVGVCTAGAATTCRLATGAWRSRSMMGEDVLCALSLVVHAIVLYSCVSSQTAQPRCSQTLWMAFPSIQPAKMACSAGGASEGRGRLDSAGGALACAGRARPAMAALIPQAGASPSARSPQGRRRRTWRCQGWGAGWRHVGGVRRGSCRRQRWRRRPGEQAHGAAWQAAAQQRLTWRCWAPHE